MSGYSIEGYGVALALRSAKTILVEGPSDKRVLTRLILQHDMRKERRTRFVIDEVALISNDAGLAYKGNKEKVEFVASSLEKLSSKLNWLVDREWEGVDLDADPMQFHAPPERAWGRRTKGHSIENYWFRNKFLSDYLKMFFGEILNADFFAALTARFDSIIRIAAAYSFASKRLGTLSRSIGLVKATHLDWTGDRYIARNSLNVALSARGCDEDLASAVNAELEKNSIQNASVAVLQWLCHGHLGEEMIRACAAHLARAFGCSDETIEAIERGARAEKIAHDADRLAELDIEHAEPLGDLISWLE
ncbi:hypothetical protein [Paraburkholderia terricola]|uniref:hypothetical protein n=1 Tax=Paraburkholderia terricola TaxID=169427 RepID=UPI00286563AE|nr:hypothetical protein [Paraburkholderia terricola]MDR6481609.1 hypothetical protein [Paraburkholderia terricola]